MKIYGPYLRKDGRKHICIVYKDGTRKTKSYPKYLMEQHLGRELSIDETVDHINRDFTDDRIENLRVLSRAQHAADDARHVALASFICPICKCMFERSPRIVSWRRKQKKAGPFCSKECSGLYGAEVQNKRQKRLPLQPAQPVESRTYYFPDKSI